jgi:hypothetical protein
VDLWICGQSNGRYVLVPQKGQKCPSELPSSAIQRRVVSMWTDVSEESITYTFRVENQPSKKPVCSRCLGRICGSINVS